MADRELKNPPSYAVASVDNALRLATMLQLEGVMSVSDVAQRLGVAKSTAHRLLAMLVYRDFAVQDDDRHYRAGPVLELAAQSPSFNSALRASALPHLRRLVDLLGESANLAFRTGDTVRFLACVETDKMLRVGSREGMVFPAHRTTVGLVTLAHLSREELEGVYDHDRHRDWPVDRPDVRELAEELAAVRRNGFAVNDGRSERGVVAVGVPILGSDQVPIAGLSVAMPSVRYDRTRLPHLVATLKAASAALSVDLGGARP
jgi:DNA-binding IclR family transcriptional regulator